jgi:hypothetical protein
MLFVGVFFTELLLLFFLSRILSVELSFFFQRITRSRKASMFLLAILFLPGTLIHELSHFFMAKILLVPTGKMSLWPRIESSKSVTMGSVEVAKCDPLRNFLIGIAPFIVGTLIITQILWQSVLNNIFSNTVLLITVAYVLFVIGNTMFSSKKDMEGAVMFYGIVLILFALGYFLGLRIEHIALFIESQKNLVGLLRSAVFLLVIPIALDVVIIAVAKTVNAIRIL